MSPQELAQRHPRLYHVTEPGAWESMVRHGLLSTARLLDLFAIGPERRVELTGKRRPAATRIEHPAHGSAFLNDNLPLSEAKLERCLDDGLTPRDWLTLLNQHVFFWAEPKGLDGLLKARMNRNRPREVLVFDTLGLATAHAERIEISPINSGATLHQPTRRGRATFTPLHAMSYDAWRRRRGLTSLDSIREVVVRDGVPDIANYLVERRTT